MKFGDRKVVTFDIETTGLSYNDDFICGVSYDTEEDITWVNESLESLMKYYRDKVDNNILLVTFNGENYRGGFDFPWLRTSFALKELDWSFYNFQHLDFYPLVKKYLYNDLKVVKKPSKSSLSKAKLEKLAEINDIRYKTIDRTYKEIDDMDNPDWGIFTKEKIDKKRYDEQSLYQTFFDSEGKEEYIDGADSAKLYNAGRKDLVIRHCVNDVHRLAKLFDLLVDYLPLWEVDRNLNRL